jgi:hypothetical protein
VSCLAATIAPAAIITGTVLNKNTQKYLERAIVEVPGRLRPVSR